MTCGGGGSSRTATCEAPQGADCDGVKQEPLQRECNTAACAVYAWQSGEWGPCSVSCDGE